MPNSSQLRRWLLRARFAVWGVALIGGVYLWFRFDSIRLSEGGCSPVIGLNPGAKFGSSKCWPPEYFARLAELLEERFRCRLLLFVGPGEEVYAGMIVGENPRKEDMPVNPTKAKQLDNMRAAGSDKGIQLSPPVQFSLERAIEYIAPDELVEATPSFLRFRKRILDETARRKLAKAAKNK